MDVQEILDDKTQSWSIFDRKVSKSYDFLSDLISLRLYRGWCRGLAQSLPQNDQLKLLDLASGTGMIPLTIFSERAKSGDQFTCVDLSEDMLNIFRAKVKGQPIEEHLDIRHGDATALEFEDGQFDAVTMACGIRNVGDTSKGLAEILRVLKPGGSVHFLEPSMPQSTVLKGVYLGYFRYVVPAVASVFSTGDAYRYFNQSVENFPHGDSFIEMIEEAGFTNCSIQKFTFGAGALYIGHKPS